MENVKIIDKIIKIKVDFFKEISEIDKAFARQKKG